MDEAIQVEVYQGGDADETLEDIRKQQKVIHSRLGESYSFYVKARI